IKIKNDRRIALAVFELIREAVARLVLGCEGAHAKRAGRRISGKLGFLQHLAPGIDGVAGEGRRGVRAAIDRGNKLRITEAVEREGARQADDMPAIDQPATEAVILHLVLVEM